MSLNKLRCLLEFSTLKKSLSQMSHQFMYTKKMRLRIVIPILLKQPKYLNLSNSIKLMLELNSNIRYLKDTNSNILNNN